MSSPTPVRSLLAAALGVAVIEFLISPALATVETKAKTELPVSMAWVSVPAVGVAGEGRIQVSVAIDRIVDEIERNGGGRLRVATFSGSAATRVLDSRAERSFPFDLSVDRWVLELPVHWSSQDTWIAVEVVETKSGAHGRTMLDLASPAVEAKSAGKALPLTLSLSGVRRTMFQSTGWLNLSIPAQALASALPEGGNGINVRIVVFETTGAGNSIAMPVHTKVPVAIGSSEEWSTRLPVRWTELASRLTVEVKVNGTDLQATGSIRVNCSE